jgi:hypothetical protein
VPEGLGLLNRANHRMVRGGKSLTEWPVLSIAKVTYRWLHR